MEGGQLRTRGHDSFANGRRDDARVDPLVGAADRARRPFVTGRCEQQCEHRHVRHEPPHAGSARPHGRTIARRPEWLLGDRAAGQAHILPNSPRIPPAGALPETSREKGCTSRDQPVTIRHFPDPCVTGTTRATAGLVPEVPGKGPGGRHGGGATDAESELAGGGIGWQLSPPRTSRSPPADRAQGRSSDRRAFIEKSPGPKGRRAVISLAARSSLRTDVHRRRVPAPESAQPGLPHPPPNR
jgi:hypothetical protein